MNSLRQTKGGGREKDENDERTLCGKACPLEASRLPSLPSPTSDQSLGVELGTLSTPSQQQQHLLPPPPSQEWVERQRKLQEQIQRQKQLLQNLLVEQEFHQVGLPGQQPEYAVPRQQPLYCHVENGLVSSLTPFPFPQPLVTLPTHPVPESFGRFRPHHPPPLTTSDQNRRTHTSSCTRSISFVGSVDINPHITPCNGSMPFFDMQEPHSQHLCSQSLTFM